MNLKEIVNAAKDKGYSKNEIVKLLSQKGYSTVEINAVLNSNKIIRKTPKQDYEAMDKIKMLFSEPLHFFEKVQEETTSNALILFFSVGFIMALISIGFRFLVGGIFGGVFGGYLGIYSIALGFGGLIFWLILSFIYAGMVNLNIKIMGGNGNYVDSYNVVAYSLIPTSILSIIPFVGFLAIFYSIVLMIFGISTLHDVSKGKAVTAVLLAFAIVFGIILLIIFLLIFNFRGLF